MRRLPKPALISLVVLAVLGLAVAGFWVIKSLFDQPIDAYAVSYRVEGLSGAEEIEYLSSSTGLAKDAKMQHAHATGSGWSEKDAVIGANDEARLVIKGASTDQIACTIIRDEGLDFEKTLSVTVTHDGGDTVCTARPR